MLVGRGQYLLHGSESGAVLIEAVVLLGLLEGLGDGALEDADQHGLGLVCFEEEVCHAHLASTPSSRCSRSSSSSSRKSSSSSSSRVRWRVEVSTDCQRGRGVEQQLHGSVARTAILPTVELALSPSSTISAMMSPMSNSKTGTVSSSVSALASSSLKPIT